MEKENILNQIIRQRRSVYPYQYDPHKKIPDEFIRQFLENANWAPNHKHTEPWRFTVFTGQGLETFSALQCRLYSEKEGENAKDKKLKKIRDYATCSSHIIAVGMKRSAKIPEVEEVLAVGCAIQNILLSATAYGLGAYISTGSITYYEEAKQYLGLGTEDKLIGFIYLGYPAEAPEPSGKRGNVIEKIRWIGKV